MAEERVDLGAIESKLGDVTQTLNQIAAELSAISTLLSRTLE